MSDNHALDYLAQAHWHHFRYRYGEMIGLDRAKREVCLAATYDDEGNEITPARTFQYDTLVMAVGSTSNDFGTPGVKEFAIPLDTLRQAERFNKRLVNACIRAHAQPEPVRPGQLHVAIIGAGATGTELAAQLHRTTRQIAAFGLDRIDPEKDFRITLIEGADRILPALPERISKATEKLLTDLGVVVRAKAKVTEVRKDGVALADGGFIPAELVVWAAGVKGPEFLRNLDGLEVNRSNQLVVTPTLETTRDPDIFAMGDCASCPREGSNAPGPAARPGGPPAGVAPAEAAAQPAGGQAPEALRLPGLRIAGVARRVLDGGQPDGQAGRRQHDDRGLLRPHHVHVALQDAPHGPARIRQGRPGNASPEALTHRTEPSVKLH